MQHIFPFWLVKSQLFRIQEMPSLCSTGTGLFRERLENSDDHERMWLDLCQSSETIGLLLVNYSRFILLFIGLLLAYYWLIMVYLLISPCLFLIWTMVKLNGNYGHATIEIHSRWPS